VTQVDQLLARVTHFHGSVTHFLTHKPYIVILFTHKSMKKHYNLSRFITIFVGCYWHLAHFSEKLTQKSQKMTKWHKNQKFWHNF